MVGNSEINLFIRLNELRVIVQSFLIQFKFFLYIFILGKIYCIILFHNTHLIILISFLIYFFLIIIQFLNELLAYFNLFVINCASIYFSVEIYFLKHFWACWFFFWHKDVGIWIWDLVKAHLLDFRDGVIQFLSVNCFRWNI